MKMRREAVGHISAGTLGQCTAKKTILESLKSGNIFYLYGFFACLHRKKKIPLPISEIN
jgi:hypothetical protein